MGAFIAIALLLACQALAGCTLSEPLRAAADRKGRFMGAILANGHLGDSQYMSLSRQHFDLVTAENECKFDALEPQQGHFNFGSCDSLLNRAKADNQTFRGHNLVWGQQVPGWVNSLQKSQKKGAIVNHINGVMAHYKGKGLYCWDVVNEAVDDSGTKLKSTVWYPDVSDYIDVAFQTAHQADPSVKLFYNDYGADGVNTKSTYIYNMVKGMVQRGVPIHGVGLQFHTATAYAPSVQDMRANFKRFGDLGLEVHLTELDVKGGSDARKQAQVYADVAEACLAEPSCKSFQTWGIVDKYSWIPNPQSEKPLLFDDSYQAKDAACSVLAAFRK